MFEADEAHDEVFLAWQCAQYLRAAIRAAELAYGRKRAEKVLAPCHTCRSPKSRAAGGISEAGDRLPGILHHRPSE